MHKYNIKTIKFQTFSKKYQLYENAGVKYYCIVDPETDCAEIFVLQKEKYKKDKGGGADGIGLDLGPCQIKLDFKKIFR